MKWYELYTKYSNRVAESKIKIKDRELFNMLTEKAASQGFTLRQYALCKRTGKFHGKCETCGKPTSFYAKGSLVFKRFCSMTCAGLSEATIRLKKLTCQKNFGTDFPQQSQVVRKTTREACKKKWGFINPSSAPSVRAKREATMLQRYGVKNIMYDEVWKKKIIAKAAKNRAKRRKVSFGGKEFIYMGYEFLFLQYLFQDVNLPVKYFDTNQDIVIPYTYKNNDKLYIPDIFFTYKNKKYAVEVKSTYGAGKTNQEFWKVIRAKMSALRKHGFEPLVAIFGEDGNYKRRLIIKNPESVTWKMMKEMVRAKDL